MPSTPRALQGLDTGRDTLERLNPDDMATVREAEFQAIALTEHQRRASIAPLVIRGMCCNCGDEVAPSLVYCNEDCREDHERLLTIKRRTGAR